jgi:putative colanic acid biosysnthesis UDP-glucose lipid carrier transferase
MNYHTNIVPSPVKESSPKEKKLINRSYPIPQRNTYFLLKRSFDIVFSVLFIGCAFTWLFPVISLLILFDSKGPVFFVQRRIGKNGRSFRCLKFRSMIINDEADEKQADKNDYRITKIGRFLRRTNLDELPQFINVLIGDMSIIGPRPHMFSDWTRFSFVIPEYRFRNLMRPGITGLAQVKGHHGPTPDYRSISTRFYWDAEYIRNACFLLDMKIVVRSLFKFIKNLISFFIFERNK